QIPYNSAWPRAIETDRRGDEFELASHGSAANRTLALTGVFDAIFLRLADHASGRDDRARRGTDRGLGVSHGRDRERPAVLDAARRGHQLFGAGAGRRGAVPVDHDQGHPAFAAAEQLHRQREPRAEKPDRLAEAVPANAFAAGGDRTAAGGLLSLHARRRATT